MRLIGIFARVLLLTACSAGAVADTYPPGSEKLMESLRKSRPDLPIVAVSATALPDFYAIELAGGQILHGSADGRHLIAGDLYSVDPLVNLTEAGRSTRRQELMAAVPLENMVVFSPAGATRTYVNVFTDVDCGYCRKLHQEIADINALGIEVRYLAYPRAGLGQPTHAKMVSAWCAENPNEAMTALKAGENIPMTDCENPTAAQYELGQKVGVTGTPAIVTADGRLLPGYMPAAQLAQTLGLD